MNRASVLRSSGRRRSARIQASVRYRPDIDGLRAIAVLPVVLYHYRVPGFSGAKLFLLHTGIPRSASGANVRGCSTFAPL